MSESDAYAPIVEYLERRGYRASRFPAGGYRARCRLGKAGWPDIVACSPRGDFVGVEVKGRGRRWEDAQLEFRAWCGDHAVAYYIVTDVADLARQIC